MSGAFSGRNNFWLSSGNGIQVIDRNNYHVLENYNLKRGLPSMLVRNILSDSAGRIWTGTAAGLALTITLVNKFV